MHRLNLRPKTRLIASLCGVVLWQACQSAPKIPPPPTPDHVDSIADLLPEAPAPATQQAAPSTQPTWTLVAVGDILLAGSAAPVLAEFGFMRPFSHYTDILRQADVTYGNFEAPVGVKGKPLKDKTFTFQMPPESLHALTEVGFDVMHLANNHILDYGEDALFETMDLLEAHGLKHCGAGANANAARRPAIVTLPNQLKIAFVCYSNTFPEEFWATQTQPGTAFGHERWVRADVAAAKAQANIVVAAFHWGAELMTEPKDYQQALARAAVEAGASTVIGHHPHVLQPVTDVNGAPVAYSLGNFVFGSYSRNVSTAAILRLAGDAGGVTDVAVLPIDVFNPSVNFHPRDLPRAMAARVAEFLFSAPVTASGRWWRKESP